MSALDALLGKVWNNGAEVELGGGLNFIGVTIAYNRATNRVDITVSGGGALADDSVTYAKIQNVSAASRVLGRGSAAGAGDPQELTCGVGIRVNGTAIELGTALAPLATLGTALQQTRVNAGATALEYFSPPSPVVGANLTNASVTKNISDGSQFTLPAGTLATSAKTVTFGTSGTPDTDEIVEFIIYAQAQDFILANGAGPVYTVPAGQKRALHLQWDGAAWQGAGRMRLA